MNRRSLILAGAAAPLAVVPPPARARPPGGGKTYVLVHGAWHGSWCWRDVAGLLRAAGHRVFTPNLTGLGQARRLLSGEITLETFVADVMNLMEMEDLAEVIPVGHSFAGVAITGVADGRGIVSATWSIWTA